MAIHFGALVKADGCTCEGIFLLGPDIVHDDRCPCSPHFNKRKHLHLIDFGEEEIDKPWYQPIGIAVVKDPDSLD